MKHWNASDTANVCGNCGFQTFSLPVFKRHSKYCSESPSKVQDMSCELLNGAMKESLALCSKEAPECSNSTKPPQNSGNKSLLYCKLCPFSCSFSSQLINHIKKHHSSESKIPHDHASLQVTTTPDVASTQTPSNGVCTSSDVAEAEEPNIKKHIVLKKLKLEIPGSDGSLNILSGIGKEQSAVVEPSSKVQLHVTVLKDSAQTDDLEDDGKLRKCPSCGFVTKNKDQLLSHKAKHEANSVVYSCNECEYRTSVRKNFERHEWCHVVDSPFKCQFCSFSSNGENAIKRHMSSYHTVKQQNLSDESNSDLILAREPSTVPVCNFTKSAKPSTNLPCKSIQIEATKKKRPHVDRTAESPPGSADVQIESEATPPAIPVPVKQVTVKLEAESDLKEDYVCPHCGLCYDENLLLEHHIKTSHGKISLYNNSLIKRPLIQHDQRQLKKLEVPNLKIKSEPLQEAKVLSPQRSAMLLKNESTEVGQEGKSVVKKVYKCGYCSFSADEFSKLREHMEHNACQPTPKSANSAVKETVLQKLLTNDNPNKVYPKIPHVSLTCTSSGTTLKSENLLSVGGKLSSETKIIVKNNDAQRSLCVPNVVAVNSGVNLTHSVGSDDRSYHSVDVPPAVHNSKCEESVKMNKTYINCLLCTYKTLSVKVIKKHLIRDHSSIICNKRILREVIQKSVMMSIKNINANRGQPVNLGGTNLKSEGRGLLDANATESDVLLHMDVQCEAENNPPALGNKKVLRQPNSVSRFRPFKCSECGKRSNWKHIIKKHAADKHTNAKVILLSSEEAEESYTKFIATYNQKFTKKFSSKKFQTPVYNAFHASHPALDRTSHFASKELESGSYASEDGSYQGSNLGSDGGSNEQLGMSDLLRLKRFKCSVCIYRSNFRCDMSRHLKKRHADVANCHYTVMSLQEASETLPNYNYSWPEAEALLASSAKDETAEVRPSAVDSIKIALSAERKAAAIVSRLPFASEEGKRCRVCPFVTDKTELLRLHAAYHRPQKRNCYSCPHCPYFVNTARLLRHHVALHENDQFIKSVAAEKMAHQQMNAYNSEFNHVKRNPKFVCEDCPYSGNNRNEFWRHRKCHFERTNLSSDLKCQHCPYWAEDKRDWHLHNSLHGGLEHNSFMKKRTDLAIREFCRCDLADLKKFPNLACFKQMRCPCCTVRSSSVAYLRHHLLTHMAFTDASRHGIFQHDLDCADETLGNLCTRLLNMNYALVEECRREPPPGQSSAEDEDKQMPVLEKVTEMSDDCPNLSISVQLSLLPTSGKVSDSSLDPFRPGVSERRRSSECFQEYEDSCLLAAPEEIVDTRSETEGIVDDRSFNECPIECEVEGNADARRPAGVEQECPHSKTLFFLAFNLVQTA